MPNRRRQWDFGPFKGVWANWRQPAPSEREFLYSCENMVFEDPANGGTVRRRPSDEKSNYPSSGTTVQLLHLFRQASSILSVSISGGEIYTYNAGTATWTRVITTAQLTAASITLSSTAPCYAVTFNNQMIVNDGVNQPFMWDGTSGSGLTALTNAPSKAYGQPTVYYGKVFFIKDVAAASADRSTLVWSEENAANTGYEAGGFNNAWTLGQSGSGALYSIEGTNDGLYYWRRGAIGVIRGAVTPDFTAAGTHDDVSTTHGTLSPRGTIYYDGYLYWADQRGKPMRAAPGGQLDYLWLAMADWFDSRNAFQGIPNPILTPSGVSLIEVVPVPYHDAIAFVYTTATIRVAWLFSHLTGNCVGAWTWTSGTGDTVGHLWDDTNGRDILVLGGTITGVRATLTTPPAVASFYGNVAGTDRGIWTTSLPFAGRSMQDALWRFDEFTALVTRPSGAWTPTLRLSAFIESLSVSSGIGDVAVTNVTEQRLHWGLAREARWFGAYLDMISSSGSTWDWGLSQATLFAYPVAAFPTKG